MSLAVDEGGAQALEELQRRGGGDWPFTARATRSRAVPRVSSDLKVYRDACDVF